VVDAQRSTLSGAQLVAALRQGGYVLIMRHPSSPPLSPARTEAHAGNDRLERQLDAHGSMLARVMGASLRNLAIRISPVYSSSAFRAREALKLIGFEEVILASELDEEGGQMSINTRWLRAQSAKAPLFGSNTLLMTHLPTLLDAFASLDYVQVGEMLVYTPAQAPTGTLVARVPIEEWPRLAALVPIPVEVRRELP
jgi:phosphohistidine phosphatase SixA